MNSNENPEPRRGTSRNTGVLLGFLAIAAYFLFSEHRAHFLYYLPFLLLLACPLMHVFHGHGGHDADAEDRDDTRNDARDDRLRDQPPAGPRPRQHHH
jgi:hypothetical protein